MLVRFLLISVSLFFVVNQFTLAQQKREDREPEAATGYNQKKAYAAKEYMVVAANPYASWAGKNIINKGGNAIDAAIAVQAMLTLVEPQSSGIGGGSFILYWDNKTKKLHTYDGRETAPSKINIDLFLKDNKPMPWLEAVVGGRAVGVPGTLKALDLAHGEFGSLPWADLFDDTIQLSTKGFTVSKRLAKLVNMNLNPGLKKFRTSSVYFFPEGQGLQAGQIKKNNALARVLSDIAKNGADSFYQGDVADKIVEAVTFSSVNPGLLSKQDIRGYKAVKRRSVCGKYKSYNICGMAPPSSGGINVVQIMRLLEPFDMDKYQPNSLMAAHLFTQASRLAYADRDVYIADSDFTHLPFSAMLSNRYLEDRAKKISLTKDMGRTSAGKPFPHLNFARKGYTYELPSTSHFSIIDKQGNAVSITSSVEFAFGSGIMVEGFMLNNQLTDFAFNPYRNNKAVLNRAEPRKRPRSSMSPTMVFDQKGELVMAIGSPGGSRIISYVAQTLIGVIDWGLDLQQAINLPKITNRNDYTALEKGTSAESLQQGLQKLGHKVQIRELNSGLHGFHIVGDKIVGGADPRREGVAVGN